LAGYELLKGRIPSLVGVRQKTPAHITITAQRTTRKQATRLTVMFAPRQQASSHLLAFLTE
jgi:hypothetical protein